jgi:hypothetical protein
VLNTFFALSSPQSALNRQCGSRCSLGVVLVRDWEAELHHQAIAHLHRDMPSEPYDFGGRRFK